MKDPMRPTAKGGVIAMEAAPVIIDGLGASSSCALTAIIIIDITINSATHLIFSAAPAILSDGISQITNFPQVENPHLFDLSNRFQM
ncbi:hypothetical protein SUGI_0015930 [Cryptomeria japonica]|nr:hypothetical protein SUGI_0015930 [Cryptomeria japonica]